MVQITKRVVDAAISEARPLYLWDDTLRGFGVRVAPSGVKSYVYQYRLGGREARKIRVTIGRHGSPWTPANARREAEQLALQVGQGVDPRAIELVRRRQTVGLAFCDYIELFTERYLKLRWKRWQTGRGLLISHAVPVFGRKALPLISRADISQLLDRLADVPGSAKLLFATVRLLFRWAVDRGDIQRSPLDGMRGPKPVPSRSRVLSDRELRVVLAASAGLGYPFGPIVHILILTGQRREEVSGMRWDELDRTTAMWTLPEVRSKNGTVHLVPLSSAVIDVLDSLIAAGGTQSKSGENKNLEWPSTGFVFTTTGKTSASGHSKAKRRLDNFIIAGSQRAGEHQISIKPWRLHDLRRTCATGLQRLGVRFEVTEAVLNHLSGARSGVAGIYQRHDWREEKVAALGAWGDHVAKIIKFPDVLLGMPPACGRVRVTVLDT